MSVIPDAVIKTYSQSVRRNRALENRVSNKIPIVYPNAGVEKDNDSWQSLEIHAKIDEIRRFSKKKFDCGHDVHRAMIEAEENSKSSKWGENQYISGVMWMSFNLFMSTDADAACLNFENTELLKLCTEKIFEIDTPERERERERKREAWACFLRMNARLFPCTAQKEGCN